MKTISVMLDCSRNAVPNVSFLKEFILNLEKCGYNELQLYTEDIYEIDGEPFFGYFRGRYTKKEIKEVDAFAKKHGITLVPAIQLLGHLATIFHWDEYKPIQDKGDCLLVDEEKTYAFIEKILKQIKSMYSTNLINIGMDESFNSGMGEHLKRFGYENQDTIYLRHLKKVGQLINKYNFKAMMWGDMFYRNMNNGAYYTKTPKISDLAKKSLPKNINIIYWDYYTLDKEIIDAMSKSAKMMDKDCLYATGAWNWRGFAPRNDFAIKQIEASLPIVNENKIDRKIITMWGDKGAECSKLSVLPPLFYFAKMCNGITDINQIKKEFKKTFKIDFDLFNCVNDINCINGKVNMSNVCTYMLYSNLISGIYDNVVDEKLTIKFKLARDKYKKLINNKEYGYLFNTLYSLSDILYTKYPLGIRIRKSYLSRNKKEILNCINELKILIKKLDKFYLIFREQWMHENKYEGFEVQSLRIGGIKKHVEDVIILLNDYLNKKIKNIPILEQKILPFKGLKKGDTLQVGDPYIAFTVNNI